ncbi:glucose-methanol-choline oxidoreductase [Colletotrichum tofieldiae]|nr:glucose-methanol-choline oxidoreductase [Colletotrichum tofieldiae]
MHGLATAVSSIYKGTRSSSWLFLEGKKNVTVLGQTNSRRLVIEKGQAVGVEVIGPDGENLTFRAKYEVIVASGVYESPKLLMLSGIGPKDHLSSFGIETIVDSPHPMFCDAFQWHIPTPPQGDYFTVIVDLLRPLSQNGTVTLNSTNPLEQAKINLNFFSDDLDLIAMREGVRFVDDIIMNGEGMKDIVESDYPWPMPRNSDEAMIKMILERSQTGFHPCGTTRMSQSVEQGVVDSKLRVHGVDSLRVVDASVIPVIPDCRIQNAVYMIAEKTSDMIKAAYPELYQ